MTWTCGRCKRTFSRQNQAHNCSAQRSDVDITKDRPEIVKKVFAALVSAVRALGENIEVAQFEKGRYALFRTIRIFGHATVTKNNVRLVINLKDRHERPLFFKYYDENAKAVQHCCFLNSLDDLAAVQDLLALARAESLAARAESLAASTSKRTQAALSVEDAPKKRGARN